MKIETLSNNNVRLTYFTLKQGEVEMHERDFFVRGDTSGYVYEWSEDGSDTSQVCSELDGMGPTLFCRNADQLAAVIRREYGRFERGVNDRFFSAAGWDEQVLTHRDPRVKAFLAEQAELAA